MFFLFYIPIISKPLSAEEIKELAAQAADRMLAGNSSPETSAEARQELAEDIAEMITAMQAGAQQKIAQSGHAAAQRTVQSDNGADQCEEDIERLAPAREFLERCFKKSA